MEYNNLTQFNKYYYNFNLYIVNLNIHNQLMKVFDSRFITIYDFLQNSDRYYFISIIEKMTANFSMQNSVAHSY